MNISSPVNFNLGPLSNGPIVPKTPNQPRFMSAENPNRYLSYDKVELKVNDIVYQIAYENSGNIRVVEYKVSELDLNGQIKVLPLGHSYPLIVSPGSVHTNKKELINYWYTESKLRLEQTQNLLSGLEKLMQNENLNTNIEVGLSNTEVPI